MVVDHMFKLTSEQVEQFDLVRNEIAQRAIFVRSPLMFWAGGMAIGRVVFLRRGFKKSSDKLIAHELVHVEQMEFSGVFHFLRRYVKDYFEQREIWNNHKEAYEHIGFEEEADHRARKWAEQQ